MNLESLTKTMLIANECRYGEQAIKARKARKIPIEARVMSHFYKGYPGLDEYRANIKLNESHGALYTIGLDIFAAKRFSIGIGAQYSNKIYHREEAEEVREYFFHDSINRNVWVYYEQNQEYQIKNWQIPISFTYYFNPSEQKWSSYISTAAFLSIEDTLRTSIGFSYWKEPSNSQQNTDYQSKWPERVSKRPFTSNNPDLGLYAGIGIRYRINKRSFTHINFRYALDFHTFGSNHFEARTFKMHRFEIGFGLNYRFWGGFY